MEVIKPDQTIIEGYIKELQKVYGLHLEEDYIEEVLELNNYQYEPSLNYIKDEIEKQRNAPTDPLINYGNVGNSYVPNSYYSLPEGFFRSLKKIKVDESMKDLFMRQSTFEEHYKAQKDNFFDYIAYVVSLLSAGLEIKDSSKARMLAALWSHKKYQIANYFLKNPNFGLTEVLKAVNLLDSNRKIRVLEKRLGRLQRLPKVKPKTLGKIQSSINDLKREPVTGSLSGALIRHIREWVKQIPQEALNFYLLNFPKEPWKELSDLLHLHPSNDFSEPSFLPIIHGKPAPEDSVYEDYAKINSDNICEILEKHKIPYSVLRKQKELITNAIKPIIASYTPLETLIWFYEELRCPEVDKIIQDKLEAGEELVMGYGKLMERLLAFKGLKVPFYSQMIDPAERKLKKTKLTLEPPVVCIGDASASMDSAIRVATIIASLMAALTNADLLFFNDKVILPPKIPRSIVDVIEIAEIVKARCSTAPAAAIYDYYQKKTQVKTFVMVTDEVENVTCEGHYFAQLFYKYRRDVYPAQIVMVSFSNASKSKGQMVRALEYLGITPYLELHLDVARPDLTKLDSMLAALSSGSASFDQVIKKVSDHLREGDLEKKLSEIISSI